LSELISIHLCVSKDTAHGDVNGVHCYHDFASSS